MSRMHIEKRSKFESMSNADMSCIKGGDFYICISCMKRARKVPIKLGNPQYNDYDATDNPEVIL